MDSRPAPGGGGEREAMVSSVPIAEPPAKERGVMNGTTGEQRSPGVYGVDRDGREQQVHPYQGGPYTLSDVVHLFDLGRLEESRRGNETETVLVLTAEEVRTLKTMADAYSFDYEEGFIEMCPEMALFADQFVGGEGDGEVRFTANF